jgi:hypothetical protein
VVLNLSFKSLALTLMETNPGKADEETRFALTAPRARDEADQLHEELEQFARAD